MSALNDMYIVTAIVTAAGVALALMLHHGPPQAVPEEAAAVTRTPSRRPNRAGPGARGRDGRGARERVRRERLERERVRRQRASGNAAGERDTSAVRG